MKRDLRLHGLTSDHHHALVLARRLEEAAARGGLDVELSAEILDRYDEDLGSHFAIEEIEEEELLPALALSCPPCSEMKLLPVTAVSSVEDEAARGFSHHGSKRKAAS